VLQRPPPLVDRQQAIHIALNVLVRSALFDRRRMLTDEFDV